MPTFFFLLSLFQREKGQLFAKEEMMTKDMNQPNPNLSTELRFMILFSCAVSSFILFLMFVVVY